MGIFLQKSGDFADSYQAVKYDCESFYHMLNEYEDSEYSKELELNQAAVIKMSLLMIFMM